MHISLKYLIFASLGMMSLSTVSAGTAEIKEIEIKGVHVPKKTPHGDGHLVLNGTAVRTVWGFNVYVVALYLAEACHDENAVMRKDHANGKRIHITMLRAVSAQKFKTAVRKNIDCNFNNAEKKFFSQEITSFLNCFPDELKLDKNSEVTVDYLPGTGTRISIDGKEADLIPGNDFYHALLRLWIGRPLQTSIKDGLMNKAG